MSVNYHYSRVFSVFLKLNLTFFSKAIRVFEKEDTFSTVFMLEVKKQMEIARRIRFMDLKLTYR